MSILTKIFGDPNEKHIQGLSPIIEKINALEKEYETFSPLQCREKTQEFKKRLNPLTGGGETLDDILPEAFALTREAARRTLKQRHFDAQLIGGIVLHQGNIAEMKTGEGKTLSAVLPAYLNGLTGQGVHIVTVNDYLARRDAVWMGQIYNYLGLTVGCITNQGGYVYDENYTNEIQGDKARDEVGGFKIIHEFLRPGTKKEAYQSDITYGTNNEFGFDYLRDNMVFNLSQESQRGHNFAIIDEVDSILIDESRVPLIISGQSEESTEKYQNFARVASFLQEEKDYEIDEKLKTVHFTEEGQQAIVKNLGFDPWMDNDITTTHQLESALKAKALYLNDKEYVVKNGEVLIIDEFTGRILPGRRWSGGLHQAVEAKEGVKIQPESSTVATITFQNYFRMYKKLAGMTGTALTSAEEFDKVYHLEVIEIPPHRQIQRKDFSDKIFKTENGKYQAVVKEIETLNKKGQPVLVGTRSVERNEYLRSLLNARGIAHNVLNAKNHEKEGEIIAQAGQVGKVTIATNMAGRGVDIILGGNPYNEEEARKVKEFGGVFVIGTERHEARRIDNQLRGRSGRQGDPGASQFFVSVDDDIMRIFGGDRVKAIMNTFNIPEDEPIQSKMISNALESAQEKIEGFNFDTRKHLLEYDDVLNKHREIIYKKRKALLLDAKAEIINANVEDKNFRDLLDKKEIELGEENFKTLCKVVGLQITDTLWQEHLSYMDNVRDSVRLRAYGGRDPLVEYKTEGHKAFNQLLEMLDQTIAENILKANLTPQQPGTKIHAINPQINNKDGQNIGRNDPCPCGSGKKYKKCHGK